MGCRSPMTALVLCAVGLAGCSSGLSNTGYEGSWSVERPNEISRIEIRRQDDAYQFRWSLTSTDGSREVRGDWEGSSREYLHGREVGRYEFRTWIDPETGRLMVECHGSGPDDATGIHYVDFLVLEQDGLALWSYTEELNGKVFEEGERPRQRFVKIADPVASGD